MDGCFTIHVNTHILSDLIIQTDQACNPPPSQTKHPILPISHPPIGEESVFITYISVGQNIIVLKQQYGVCVIYYLLPELC